MNGVNGIQPPGVIFDLDGTLADTLYDITDSINQIFEQAGVGTVTYECIRSLIGHGLKSLLQRASGVQDEDCLTRLVKAYRPVYVERMLVHTQLYPGVAAVLDTLSELGLPLAVLSNKPDEFTVPICEALLARWSFVHWRGLGEENHPKPDPTSAIEIAGKLGRVAGNVYFVGDSAIDVSTGKNAGMIPVAVTWGYRDRGELTAAAPDHLVETPVELLDLIRNRM